ncbi:mannose-binding protein C-like [Branchiostoma floridae x Branchiostoma japonicum]
MANLRCIQSNAHLASVNDANENNFIEGLISTGGSVVWTDGSRLTYTNWAPGEPNNDHVLPISSHQENCVGVYSKTYRKWPLGAERKRGKWNDARCDWRCPYVCKRPIQYIRPYITLI